MSISSLLVRGSKKGYWAWNDVNNDLQFISLVKEKKQKKQKEKTYFSAINGLTYAALKVDLKFKATVNELELMYFRHFLKKLNQGREDSIVTIQDCKIVAIFLCVQPLPGVFQKFYNLLSVNHLLRACIVYIQFYLQTCERIVKTQHYLRGNPLPPNRTPSYQALKEDLDDLRVLIGRFYARIIFGELGAGDISKTDEILLFEYFLRVSTVVVWIALERKYLNVIKVELERIFRTAYFNNFNNNETNNILHLIKPENHVVLNGKIAEIDKKKTKTLNRLMSNSPIIHNFLRMDEPKLIMIGSKDFEPLLDNRLRFLEKYIFVPENKILEEGLSIGILGHHRRLYDPLLYPCSKRVLKLLVTGSPMDISEDRKKLREDAWKKSQRESEAQSPHIFNNLSRIPRPEGYHDGSIRKFEKIEKIVEFTTEEIAEEEEEEEGEEDEGEGEEVIDFEGSLDISI